MKIYIYFIAFSIVLFGCNKNDDNLPAPTEITNVTATPIEGGALLKWTIPSESEYSYVEVRYLKNQKKVTEKASIYTDSLVVTGLINKEPLSFELTTINEDSKSKSEASLVTTETVTPIKREPAITYFPNDLTKLDVTADMLDTYTQESTEGAKNNLVDGDVTTYWHSAWSGGVEPLPHWIQLNFANVTKLGAITYWFRPGGDVDARPSQWGLDVSNDGTTWNRVWTSAPDLPVADNTVEHKVAFDKNYESQYFRVMILKNNGKTYTHLGEISFFSQGEAIVDREKEAEEIYYNY